MAMRQIRPGTDTAVGMLEANPGLDDAEFMDALDHGIPAPLSLYRRAYAAAGVPWPGDDEVRRRHRVTTDDATGDATGDAPISVRLLTWPEPE